MSRLMSGCDTTNRSIWCASYRMWGIVTQTFRIMRLWNMFCNKKCTKKEERSTFIHVPLSTTMRNIEISAFLVDHQLKNVSFSTFCVDMTNINAKCRNAEKIQLSFNPWDIWYYYLSWPKKQNVLARPLPLRTTSTPAIQYPSTYVLVTRPALPLHPTPPPQFTSLSLTPSRPFPPRPNINPTYPNPYHPTLPKPDPTQTQTPIHAHPLYINPKSV